MTPYLRGYCALMLLPATPLSQTAEGSEAYTAGTAPFKVLQSYLVRCFLNYRYTRALSVSGVAIGVKVSEHFQEELKQTLIA